MSSRLEEIQKILKENASQKAFEAAKKFVPHATKIYGIRTPFLNELAIKFKEGEFSLVKELWDAGAFEEKILAAKMLGKIAKKDPEQSLMLVEYFADGINDWAVCDAIGMQSLQPIRTTHQQQIFTIARKYNHSKNFWKRRLSLVLIEWYTRDISLHPQINKLVSALENDQEYYVKKAATWIKRNMQKGK